MRFSISAGFRLLLVLFCLQAAALEALFVPRRAGLQALVSTLVPGTKRIREAALNPTALEAASVPGSRFELELFPGLPSAAVTLRREANTSGGWTVVGQFENEPQSQFILSAVGEALMGSAFLPGQGNFRIEYAQATGGVRIMEVDPATSGKCETCSGQAGNMNVVAAANAVISSRGIGKQEIPPIQGPGTNSVSIVDVMVVYTPAAQDGAGGTNAILALIDLGLAEVNTIYQNSQANIRFRLIQKTLVDYNEYPNLSTNLNRLKTVGDGFLDEVHVMRATNRADLVCLVTETADAGFAGLAFTMSDPPSSAFGPFAFSVVKRSELVATYTFAHELSHNLGCQHDREHSLDSKGKLFQGSYPYSFGYRFLLEGTTNRTLMAYEPGIQVPFLSNPRISFRGVALGISSDTTNGCDNAKTVNLNAGFASAYMGDAVFTLPPSVTLTAPANGTVTASGQNMVVSVTASDGGGSIQQVEFYADYLFLGIVTNAPYSLTWSNTPPGKYNLTARAVDNQGASSVATFAAITIRPANDSFTNAIPVTGTNWTVNGANRSATSETGEPKHDTLEGGVSVWYRWTAPKSGTVDVTASGTGFNPLIGVYRGTNMASLVSQLTSLSFSTNEALVTFDAVAGVSYSIAVDGFKGFTGNFEMASRYKGAPPNDFLVNAEVLTNTPVSFRDNNFFATTETGETNHAGNPSGKSVWYRWIAPRTGTVIVTASATNYFVLPDVYIGTIVSNLVNVPFRTVDFDTTNMIATLTFEAVGGQSYALAVAGVGGDSGWFGYDLQMPPAPANDAFEDRISLSGLSLTIPSDNRFATLEPGEPKHANNTNSHSVWYNWKAPVSGPVTVTGISVGYNTVMDVYTGTNVTNLVVVPGRSVNFNSTNDFLYTTVKFNAVLNKSYALALAGFAGASGTNTITLQALNVPPSIRLPAPVRITSNGSFAFDVDGSSNTLFLVEVSTNLITWAPFSTNKFVSPIFTVSDTNAVSAPYRFFRISALP